MEKLNFNISFFCPSSMTGLANLNVLKTFLGPDMCESFEWWKKFAKLCLNQIQAPILHCTV